MLEAAKKVDDCIKSFLSWFLIRAWTKLCKKTTTVLWCEFKRFRFRIQNSPLLFSAYVMLLILLIVGPIQFIFTFHSVLDQNIHYLNDESHKLVAYYYDSLKMAYSVFVFISLCSFLPSHSHFFSLPLSAPPTVKLRESIHGFHLLQIIFKPSGPTFSIYRSAKSLHPQSRGDLIRGGRQTVLGRSSSGHLPRLLHGICVMRAHTHSHPSFLSWFRDSNITQLCVLWPTSVPNPSQTDTSIGSLWQPRY